MKAAATPAVCKRKERARKKALAKQGAAMAEEPKIARRPLRGPDEIPPEATAVPKPPVGSGDPTPTGLPPAPSPQAVRHPDHDKKPWLAKRRPGVELDDRGQDAGRDPLQMPRAGLEALGHQPMSPMAAIRATCLDCSHTASEVRLCVVTACPLWPFRLGRSPWKAPKSEAQIEAARRVGAKMRAARQNPGSLQAPDDAEASPGTPGHPDPEAAADDDSDGGGR